LVLYALLKIWFRLYLYSAEVGPNKLTLAKRCYATVRISTLVAKLEKIPSVHKMP